MAINTALLIAAPVLQEPILDDATGLPLVGGIVKVFQDNSRTTFKNWYYQTGAPGAYSYLPLNNPLTLNAAGVITDPNGNDTLPFFYPYSEVDNVTAQPYYITVTDAGGHSKITRQNFPFNPANTNIVNTVNATLKNYIVNNVFWRNASQTVAIPLSGTTFSVLAPSIHQGLVYTSATGNGSPDITFAKSGGGVADTITFSKMAAGQFFNTTNPPNLDVTTEYFLNFNGASGGNETSKYVQFPLALHLKTLDNVQATITFYARNNSNSASQTLLLSIYQYAGANTTSSVTTNITGGSFNLPGDMAWHKYTVTFNTPVATGIAVGAGEDDAVFLRFNYPLNAAFNIDMAKPSFYIGNQAPTNDIDFYDQAEAIFNSPRTGDIKQGLMTTTPFGWVAMNGSTIGSVSSGATLSQAATWPLYNLLWNNVNDAFVFLSGAPGNRGSSAMADFGNNKPMTITSVLGRVLMGLPSALNVTSYTAGSAPTWNSGTNGFFTTTSNATLYPGMPLVLTGTSLNAAFTSGNLYYAIPALDGTATQFQLATTYVNAIAGTAIPASGGATGTGIVVTPSLGGNLGQDEHVQLVNELAAHNHPGSTTPNGAAAGSGNSVVQSGTSTSSSTLNIASQGLSYPFNIVQPSLMVNVYMKL